MDRGEGERLHSERRKRFWRMLGGLMLIGFATGIVGSFVRQADKADFPSWGPAAGAIGVVIVAIVVAWRSWRFFADVDEVEVADNLWGSLIGFYTYAILFPAWWALNKLGQVPEPNHWAIFIVSMFAALLVYFFRKARYT